jgi:DNA-binding MarR family transcriptional regulator
VTTRATGGGPLRSIADDESRGDGERAFAASLIAFMQQRQSLHAKRLPLDLDVPLSFAQLKLLFHLPHDGSAVPLGRYAESIGITPAALTQALGPVEQAGLVERERSTVDKRVVEARITGDGRVVLEQLRHRFGERWNALFAEFSDEQVALAARVLDRASTLFSLDPPTTPPPPATRS